MASDRSLLLKHLIQQGRSFIAAYDNAVAQLNVGEKSVTIPVHVIEIRSWIEDVNRQLLCLSPGSKFKRGDVWATLHTSAECTAEIRRLLALLEVLLQEQDPTSQSESQKGFANRISEAIEANDRRIHQVFVEEIRAWFRMATAQVTVPARRAGDDSPRTTEVKVTAGPTGTFVPGSPYRTVTCAVAILNHARISSTKT